MMSPCLSLDAVSVGTPDGILLFKDLTVTFGRERVGVVGRNGSGKSTLLRLLAGAAEPDVGTLTRVGTVGLLRQDRVGAGIPVGDVLGVSAAIALLHRLARGEGDAEDAAEADWTLEARIEIALAEVGLPSLALARDSSTLSGGERTRLAIARMLIEAPDLLLMDEPTNDLDAEGRLMIERLIAGRRGGTVVASHDRTLLDRMDRIVELSPVGCSVVAGGWSAFAAPQDAARRRAGAELDRAAREVKRVDRDIQRQRERQARRAGAGRAWRVTGSDGTMALDAARERADRTAARDGRTADLLSGDARAAFAAARERVEVLTPLAIDMPATGLPSSRELLRFDEVVLVRGERVVFGPLSFVIRGPERIALVGQNGAGKSSLLELATGTVAPSGGRVVRAGGPLALLDQHVDSLDPAVGILENLCRLHPELSPQEARAALARFAFRNAASSRIVATLSGGERLRAGLACALSGRPTPQLLLLDEPTNHLDLDSIAVLEAAMSQFDGALLVASHDPAFLGAIGIERTLVLGP